MAEDVDVYINLVLNNKAEVERFFDRLDNKASGISIGSAITQKELEKKAATGKYGYTGDKSRVPDNANGPKPDDMRYRNIKDGESYTYGKYRYNSKGWGTKVASRDQSSEWWDKVRERYKNGAGKDYRDIMMAGVRKGYNAINMSVDAISDGAGHARSFGINSFNIEDMWRVIVDKYVDFIFGKLPDALSKTMENIRHYVSEKFGFDVLTGEEFDDDNKVTPPWKYGGKVYKRGLYMSATSGGYDNTWYDENGWAENGQYDFNPYYTHGDNTSSRRGNLPINMGRGSSPSNPHYVPDFQGDFKDRDWGYYNPNWTKGKRYSPDWVFGTGYVRQNNNWMWNDPSHLLGEYYTPNWTSNGWRNWYYGQPVGNTPLLSGDVGPASKQTKPTADNDQILDTKSKVKYHGKTDKQRNKEYSESVGKVGKLAGVAGGLINIVGWVNSKAASIFKIVGGLFSDIYKVALKSLFKPATLLFKGFTSLLKDAVGKSQIIQAIHNMVVVPFIIMLEYLLVPAIKIIAPMITNMVKLIVKHKDTILEWGDTLAEIFNAVLGPFLNMLGDGSDFWNDPFKGLLDAFTEVLKNILSWVDSHSDEIGKMLVDVFEAGMDYLASSVELAEKIISIIMYSLSDAMNSDKWTSLIDTIADAMVVVFDAIQQVIYSSKVMSIIFRLTSDFIGIFLECVKIAMTGGDEQTMVNNALAEAGYGLKAGGVKGLYYDASTGEVHRQISSLSDATWTMNKLYGNTLYNKGIFTEQSKTNSNIYYIDTAKIDLNNDGYTNNEEINKFLQSMGSTTAI